MKREKWESETELASYVVSWLQEQHWDVYQEVKTNRGSGVADIVAVSGRLIWVIECKLTMSLQLMAQALNWCQFAHYISVAVPASNKNTHNAHWYARRVLAHDGIGMITVSKERQPVSEREPAKLNRSALVDYVRDSLRPEQKTTLAAGSNGGGYWTPFRSTSLEVVRRVTESPGICLKDLIDSIKTHYASQSTARACLSRLAQDGVIKGVRTEFDGKRLRFYPTNQESEAH